MRSERLARPRLSRSFSLALVAFTLAPLGCGYVVSVDEELIDEFAHFKARGGLCLPGGGGGSDEEGALEGATLYRWLAHGGLLREVVTPDGFVRYGLLNGDPELLESARTTVRQVRDIEAMRLSGKSEKLAFWLNAYNALTLEAAARGVAEDPGFRVDADHFAFFDQEVHVIGGDVLSLNQIENGVIRGDPFHASMQGLDEGKRERIAALHEDLWGGATLDPRFHFVLNCASRGCPPLQREPLRGDTLEDVMESATHAFLHDEERGAGPNGISQIFSFSFVDFEAAGGVDAFIARYRDLEEVNTARFLPYDWALNDALP